MPQYFVRIGALGELQIGSGPRGLSRNCRVVVRTGRGVEIGEVVSPSQVAADSDSVVQRCAILRPTNDADEMLISRMTRRKRSAVASCQRALSESGSSATLLDIDQLFDGSKLMLLFLGPVDASAERVTADLAEQYESYVETRSLVERLNTGCGPGCGEGTAGCGTACAGCAKAEICRRDH